MCASFQKNVLGHRLNRHRAKQTTSSFSITSDEYNIPPDSLDLRKFRCTEKVSYLGEFELSDDSSVSEGEDDITRNDFGQSLYLGE